MLRLLIGLLLIVANTYLPFIIDKKWPSLFYIGLFDTEWYVIPNICIMIAVWFSIYATIAAWVLV